jgi:hypothetical protein
MSADPTALGDILAKQGPIAFALILVSLLLIGFIAFHFAYVKWNQANTVPVVVWQDLCASMAALVASVDGLRIEVARRGAGR